VFVALYAAGSEIFLCAAVLRDVLLRSLVFVSVFAARSPATGVFAKVSYFVAGAARAARIQFPFFPAREFCRPVFGSRFSRCCRLRFLPPVFPRTEFSPLGLILLHSAQLDPSRVLRLSLIAFCDFCWKSAAVSVLSARASRLISFFAASLVAFRDFCWKRAA
jgi:hypothetical protein